jgi:hypothetical protein
MSSIIQSAKADTENQPPEYGVVDYPEQFGELFPNFKGTVYFHCIKRATEPRGSGGWRWRKWGPYLGKNNIRGYEYLSEADGSRGPIIDEQWCFSIESDNFFTIPYYF